MKQRPRLMLCDLTLGPICCHSVNTCKSVNIKGTSRFFQGLLRRRQSQNILATTQPGQSWSRGEIRKE